VYFGVALGTFGHEGTFGTLAVRHSCIAINGLEVADRAVKSRVEVSLMTLQAEKWLIARQEVVCNGSVRVVAGCTVLDNRRVLKDEGALLVRVTGKTQVVGRITRGQPTVPIVVRRVAIEACHQSFSEGVMRRHAQSRNNILVTGPADFERAFLQKGLSLFTVNDVARSTRDVAHSVHGALEHCVFGGAVTLNA